MPNLQHVSRKYKERVAQLGNNVKDEEGHKTAFTEQGATVSQTAEARFLDTISKLPDLAGEKSDAVSVYTQVKMTGARSLLRLPTDERLYVVPYLFGQLNTLARSVTKW